MYVYIPISASKHHPIDEIIQHETETAFVDEEKINGEWW
jgi:hypothetical protein